MQAYSPFYMFLSYLQLGSIMLTFILQIVGIVATVIAIRALLIYIKKNREPKANKAPIEVEPSITIDSEENSADSTEEKEAVEAEIITADGIEEVEAEIVTPDSEENETKTAE